MKCRGHQFHFGYYERPSVVVDTDEALETITQQYGMLVTPFQAAAMAKVTNQRIYSLIEAGKFTKIVVFGVLQIPKKELNEWKRSERKAGRPRRQNNGCLSPTISQEANPQNGPDLFAELPAQRKGRKRVSEKAKSASVKTNTTGQSQKQKDESKNPQ